MAVEGTTSTKPKGFLASAVKSLFIKWEVNASIIAPVLKACSGITVLALYIPDTYASPELWDVMTSDLLGPIQLAFAGSALPARYRDFLQPIFRNVTHLEILWEDPESLNLEWSTLHSLHQLTHISVDIQFDPEDELVVDVAKDILAQCPTSIQVCIIWVLFESYFNPDSEDYGGILALHQGEVDPRVVVGYSAVDASDEEEEVADLRIQDASLLIRFADVVAGWSKPSTAKMTIWSRAEERIEQRLRERREKVSAPGA